MGGMLVSWAPGLEHSAGKEEPPPSFSESL